MSRQWLVSKLSISSVSRAWCPVLGVQTVQCVQCLLSNGLSPMVGDQWLVSNGWCPNCRTFFAVSCLALITASSIYGLTVPNRNWTLGQIKCQGSPLLYGFLIPLAQQKAAPYFGSQGYHWLMITREYLATCLATRHLLSLGWTGSTPKLPNDVHAHEAMGLCLYCSKSCLKCPLALCNWAKIWIRHDWSIDRLGLVDERTSSDS